MPPFLTWALVLSWSTTAVFVNAILLFINRCRRTQRQIVGKFNWRVNILKDISLLTTKQLFVSICWATSGIFLICYDFLHLPNSIAIFRFFVVSNCQFSLLVSSPSFAILMSFSWLLPFVSFSLIFAVFLFFFQIKASLQPHIKYIKASQFGSTVWPGFYLVRITVWNLANWRIVLSTWWRSALKIHWKKVRSEKSLTRPWRKNSIVWMVLWKFPPCRQPTDRFVQHHSAVMQTLAFDLFTKSLPRTNQIPLFARKFKVYTFLQYTYFYILYTLYRWGGGGGGGRNVGGLKECDTRSYSFTMHAVIRLL